MATWYHDSLATGANNGTSWADAFTDIASLNAKANYDTCYTRNGQTITSSITLTKYLYIIGCNAAGAVDGTRSVFDFNNAANSITFADYTDCFNLTFRRSTASPAMVTAGWYSGWYNCRFELAAVYGILMGPVFNMDGCEFSAITNFSLQASTGRNGTIANTSFIDTGSLYLANCFVTFDKCTFKVSSAQAVSLVAGGYPAVFSRCCFYGATTYHIYSTSYNNYVSECRFEGGPAGVRVDNNNARVTLRNNTFFSVTNKVSLATGAKAHDLGNGLFQSAKSQFVNAAGGNFSSIPDADILGVPLVIGASTTYSTPGMVPLPPVAQDPDTVISTAVNSDNVAGTVVQPSVSEVLDGVLYGPNSTLEGTYAPTYADPADVIEGVDRGDGTDGTYHPAQTSDVADGVMFGPSATLEGTFTLPQGTVNTPQAAQVGSLITTTFATKPALIVAVTCDGVAAVIDSQNAAAVSWTVPDGASGDAAVVFTDTNGDTAYTQIRVAAGAEPTIINISIQSGSKGDSIVITGENFGALRGGGAPLLGGLCLTSVGWSDTRISGRIPSGLIAGTYDIMVVTDGGLTTLFPDAFELIAGSSGAPLYWDLGSWDVNTWSTDVPRIRTLKLPPSAKGAMVRIKITQRANDPTFNILEMKLQGTALKTRLI